MEERIKVALILSVLSPVFGELVSGSSPPMEFFNPLAFFLLWGLYGGGVLLVRDAWVKWGKGYTRLMTLGIIYGIAEEGLAIKSFFDPGWADLAIFSTYGRFAGVNFAWAFWLVAFHTIYSITVPVFIVQAFYPQFGDAPLLKSRGKKLVMLAFLLSTAAMFFGLNPYVPPPVQYILTFAITVSLLKWVARTSGRPLCRIAVIKRFSGRPGRWSALLSSAIFVNFVFLPHSPLPAPVVCSLGLLLLFSLYGSMRMKSPVHLLASAIGLLVPIVLFYDIVLELSGVIGMSVVGLLVFIFLIRSYRKTKEGATHQNASLPQKI